MTVETFVYTTLVGDDTPIEELPAEICAKPVTQGPNKGKPATGLPSGRWRHKNAGEPLCDECREAHNARNRAYDAADPERKRARGRDYYRRNRRKVIVRTSLWQQQNRELVNDIARRWRENNREASRRAVERWRVANLDKAAEVSRRRRAMERAALTIPFTADELDKRMSMFGFRCWMCAGPFEHVDHVKPIAKGGAHILANLRPACEPCNVRKQAQWPWPTEVQRAS